MEDLMAALQWIIDFFGGDGETSFFQQIQAYIFIWWLKFKIFAVQHAWGVASAVIAQLGISTAIDSAWNAIDSTTMSYLTFFKVPDAINVLVSARVTRMVLSFMKVV